MIKRLLFALVIVGALIVLPSRSDAAAPAFVTGQVCSNTADAASATITCVFPGNTTTGNLLVCGFTNGTTGTITSVTDGTNAQTQAVTATHASGQVTKIYYAANITGLTTPTVTVTFDSLAAFRRIVCAEYTGIVTSSPVGVTDSNISDTGTSITTNDGSPPTTTAGNELIVGVATSEGSAATWSAGSGFTERAENSGNFRLVLVDKVETTGGTTAEALFTLSTTDEATAVMATFKAVDTGGGGPAAPKRTLLLGVGE